MSADDERKTHKEFPFLQEDPKWHGSVKVVERVVHYGGHPRTYVDLVLHVGKHHVTLPWSGIGAIEVAIREAKLEGEARRLLHKPSGHR